MSDSTNSRLLRDIDPERDHMRGGDLSARSARLVYYGDFLCSYCRRLRTILKQLRSSAHNDLTYVFRHFPNERIHPGADFMARAAEAAANQGRFWEMYDALFDKPLPFGEKEARDLARKIGLDMEEFERDVDSADVRARVQVQLEEGRRDGVSATPTIFIDGARYDGAWDYYSLLDVLERPVGERIQRSARAFANLPASGGLVLILAALAALLFANSPLAGAYQTFIQTPFGIGPPGSLFSLTIANWFSEGLLAFFFLLVGLEIRRELTAGALTDSKAATLPIVAAIVASIVPALIYLSINRGGSASGWSVPTATNIAFALGVLALFGSRIPAALRIFVAAFAIVDDIISVLILAIFYPHNFEFAWLIAAAAGAALMFAFNRWRIYATWPYVVIAVAVWFFLHSSGVNGALAGIILAGFLPARPRPAAGPLLAQAATALAALEHVEKDPENEDEDPVVEWASRNLSAASERLLSPANRIEQSVAPWSTYVVLPLFAFSATGVALRLNLSAPEDARILFGVILGLVIGKPLGVCVAAWLAARLRVAQLPKGTSIAAFLGAACLCGIGDPVSLLMAELAFPGEPALAAIAKIGVLIGSALSAMLGAAIILADQSIAARAESHSPA